MAKEKKPPTIKYPPGRGKWNLRARVVPDRGKNGGRWYWRFDARESGATWTARPASWLTEKEVNLEVTRLFASGEWQSRRPSQRESTTPPVVIWQLIRRWIDHQADRPRRTSETIRTQAGASETIVYRKVHPLDRNQWQAREFGMVELANLTSEEVEGYVNERTGEGGAPLSIRNELQELRKAWVWGQKKGWCPTRDPDIGPLIRELNRRPPVRPKYTPSPGEVAALLEYLPPWPRMMVLLMHVLGCRTGEAATLTWDRVKWLEEGLEVRVVGKNRRKYPDGYRRIFVLNESAPKFLSTFRAWQESQPLREHGYVLGVKPATSRRVQHRLRAACEEAGMPYWSPTGLRRAMSVRLMESGIGALSYEAHMDHSWKVGRESYAEITAQHQRVAAAVVRDLPAGDVVPFPAKRAHKTVHKQ